jgi:hypothetical protein
VLFCLFVFVLFCLFVFVLFCLFVFVLFCLFVLVSQEMSGLDGLSLCVVYVCLKKCPGWKVCLSVIVYVCLKKCPGWMVCLCVFVSVWPKKWPGWIGSCSDQKMTLNSFRPPTNTNNILK